MTKVIKLIQNPRAKPTFKVISNCKMKHSLKHPCESLIERELNNSIVKTTVMFACSRVRGHRGKHHAHTNIPNECVARW